MQKRKPFKKAEDHHMRHAKDNKMYLYDIMEANRVVFIFVHKMFILCLLNIRLALDIIWIRNLIDF